MSVNNINDTNDRQVKMRPAHKKEIMDMTAFHNLCKRKFILPGHGTPDDYKTGERVMTLGDLDLEFIGKYGYDFYWSFFDDMYINVQMAKFIENLMDVDNLRFNENNIETLEYLYPKLSSRARLVGDEGLAKILRHYQVLHNLDVTKLACQVYTAAPDFIQEFIPPWAKIRPVNIDIGVGIDCVLVVTQSDTEFVSTTIEHYASHNGISVSIDKVEPGTLSIKYNGVEALLTPGDAVNLEKGSIRLVKYDSRGRVLDTLKIQAA